MLATTSQLTYAILCWYVIVCKPLAELTQNIYQCGECKNTALQLANNRLIELRSHCAPQIRNLCKDSFIPTQIYSSGYSL